MDQERGIFRLSLARRFPRLTGQHICCLLTSQAHGLYHVTGVYAAIDRLRMWSALQLLAYQVRHATLIFACIWAGLCGAANVLIHKLPYLVGTGAACLTKLLPVPAGSMGPHLCTSLILKQGVSRTAIGTW